MEENGDFPSSPIPNTPWKSWKMVGEVIRIQPCLFSTLKNHGFLMDGNWESYFQPLSHGIRFWKDPTGTAMNRLAFNTSSPWLDPKASRNDACAFSTKRWWHVHQHQQEGIKLAQEFHSCKKKAGNWKESKSYSVWVWWFNLFYYGKSKHWMCLNDRTEIDFLSSHSHGVFCCQGQHE